MNSKLFILALALNLSLSWAQLVIPRQKVLTAGGLIGGSRLIRTGGLINTGLIGGGGRLIGGGGRLIGGLGGYRTGGLIAAGGPVLVGGQTLVGAQNLAATGNLAAYAGLLGTYRLGGLGLHYGQLSGNLIPYQGPVEAAVETIRNQYVVEVPTTPDQVVPSTLIVEPNILPVNIEFRSQSSPINPTQVHIPGRQGTIQETSSEEEPDVLRHEVVKPIIQEVRETIVPFRRITQEILPVQEEVNSVVARGVNQKVVVADQAIGRGVAIAGRGVALAGRGVLIGQQGGLIGQQGVLVGQQGVLVGQQAPTLVERPVLVGGPSIAVAQPDVGVVEEVVEGVGPALASGVVGVKTALPGQLVATGINRFGGALPRGLELIKARKA